MGVLLGEDRLAWWIQKEVELKTPLKKGMHGQAVKRVQEWLNFRGYGLVIDGNFGRVAEKKSNNFKKNVG